MELKTKVTLNMRERLTLYAMIQQKGSDVTYPLIREFRNDLAPGEDEIARAGLVSGPGQFTNFKSGQKEFVQHGTTVWNDFDAEGSIIDLNKDVEICSTVLDIIKAEIEKLKTAKNLDDNTYPLWILFCKEGGK